MYQIIKDDNIDKIAWDNLQELSPTVSWFQSNNCYQFYKKLDFLKPLAIAIKKQDELLALVCGYIIADGGMYQGRRPDIFVTTELAHNTKGAAHRNMKKNGKLIFRCSASIIGDY